MKQRGLQEREQPGALKKIIRNITGEIPIFKQNFGKVKRLTWLMLLWMWGVAAQPADCYTVVVGKSVSKTGHVLAAHNEDDYGNLVVNLYRVPAGFFRTRDSAYVKDDPWFARRPAGLLWFQTTRQDFGDAYVNEYGITIFSNQCRSREDTASGRLTHDLRRLVIQYAESARHGVKLLGHLVEKYGYGASGRTYTIADDQEAYLVAVVQGRHWMAQRVPDDRVAVIPNYYTIDKVNLADTINFLYSPDIVSYAISRGWYDPATDGDFSFRRAYADPSTLDASWNKPRHWAGLRYLKPSYYYADYYNPDDEYPFAVEPDSLVGVDDLQTILSDHFEGSALGKYDGLDNPHNMEPLPVCHRGNKFALVVMLMSKFPWYPGNFVYWAPMNGCMHPFVPLSLAVERIPRRYQSYPLREALDKQRQKEPNLFEQNPRHLFSILEKHRKWVNKDYFRRIGDERKAAGSLEDKIRRIRQRNNPARGSTKILKAYYKFYRKRIKHLHE